MVWPHPLIPRHACQYGSSGQLWRFLRQLQDCLRLAFQRFPHVSDVSFEPSLRLHPAGVISHLLLVLDNTVLVLNECDGFLAKSITVGEGKAEDFNQGGREIKRLCGLYL